MKENTWQFHHKKNNKSENLGANPKWMVKPFFLPISFFTPIWFCWIFWCQGLYQVEDAWRHWMHNFSSMPSWTTPQQGFSSMLPCWKIVETCQHPQGVMSHTNRKPCIFTRQKIRKMSISLFEKTPKFKFTSFNYFNSWQNRLDSNQPHFGEIYA